MISDCICTLCRFEQVSQVFRPLSVDKINDVFVSELSRSVIIRFLDRPDVQAIFFKESRGTLEVSDMPSRSSLKSPVFYIVKLHGIRLTEGKISEEVIYGDIATDPLEHMALLAEDVYAPLVASKYTPLAWSETVSKDVKDNFDSFVANVQITQGHVRGVTCLPLPSTKRNNQNENGDGNDDERLSEWTGDAYTNRRTQHSQIHTLESAIITWTKQVSPLTILSMPQINKNIIIQYLKMTAENNVSYSIFVI